MNMKMQSTIATAGLCAGLLAFSPIHASAGWALNAGKSQLTNDVWKLNVSVADQKITITGYSSGSGDIDFSDGITDAAGDGGYAVTAVNSQVFNGKQVTAFLGVPDLERIGSSAFCNNGLLRTFEPSLTKLTELGEQAFNGCTSLVGDFDMPEVVSLPYLCFKSTRITSVRAPKATFVGSYALQDCKALISVQFGAPMASIGTEAFHNASALQSVSGATNLTSIGWAAFHSCWSLRTFEPSTLPMLTSIAAQAFRDCSSLAGDFDVPALTTLGSESFYSTQITSFSAKKLKTVGANAFERCGSLANVVLYGGGTLNKMCFCRIASKAVIIFVGPPPAIGELVFVNDSAYYPEVRVAHRAEVDNWINLAGSSFKEWNSCTTDEKNKFGGTVNKRLKGLDKRGSNCWLVDDSTEWTIITVQ